jgi:hypothetical protein
MTTPRHPEPPEEGPPTDEDIEGQDRPEEHGEQDRRDDYAQPGGWDDRQEDGTPSAPRPTPEEQVDG